MARRQRCVSCWKLFTPNYRNRTKVSAQQRVCADCGAVIGHRFAGRRYRASDGTLRRSRDADQARASPATAPDTAATSSPEKVGDAVPAMAPSRLVHTHLAAIAALFEARAQGTEPGPGLVERISIGLGARRNRLIA